MSKGYSVIFKEEHRGVRTGEWVKVNSKLHEEFHGKSFIVGHITFDNIFCLYKSKYDSFATCYMGFSQIKKLTNEPTKNH